MMSLKRLNIINQLKKFNSIGTTNTSNFVKKTDYNTKINETQKKLLIMDGHAEYITTQEFKY